MFDKEFIKKLFEQSFLIICLISFLVFLIFEHKRKNDRDEQFLLERVEELNEKNSDLYERLIDCNK